MAFKKYMHVERFGNDEVQGIELGDCYIFPKLDGTNASVWTDGTGNLCAGSRNRQLSLNKDNAGFLQWVKEGNHNLQGFFNANPHLRLYGEWLVPHSLKTYRDDAWRRFYVFDVYNDVIDCFLPYLKYRDVLDFYNLDYIRPLCVMRNATYEKLLHELESNTFLIKEGKGHGEGIVLKNYNFTNHFGRVVWAKVVSNSFKEENTKAMGPDVKKGKKLVEQYIADEFVTDHLVSKVYAKIINDEQQGWSSKYIPRLLSTVFYDLINEELWNVIKKTKNPTINFKTLNTLVIQRIKELKPELF